MPIKVIVPSVALEKRPRGSAVEGSLDDLVAAVPLSTEGTMVNPSTTTSVQARGIDVVVVLLGRGKKISSGRFDGAMWDR
jgi:hypothetical protein